MIEAVRAVKNDNNEYNLQFLKESEWLFLYDNSSIRESVRKEVESWNIPEETEIVILIGVGLGYHAMDLINFNKRQTKSLDIILIEPIELIAQLANKLFNLNKIFSSLPHVHYLYGIRSEVQQRLYSLISKLHIKLNKVKFFIPDNYVNFFSKEVKDIIKLIKSRVIANAIKVGNAIDDTILGIYNMFRNSQSISESLPLKILENYYKGFPFVIVSAGPSLNKNIHILKKYQDRVIIIATDATFKILIEKGIRVDFVTVLERDYITYNKFFRNLSYNEIPTLIYQSVAWPNIPASFRNSKVVTFKTLPTEEKFGESIGKGYVSIPSGTSVATMSISLAYFMGAKDIILIGQDLAYSEEGYTHAEGVSVKKKINLKNTIELDGLNGKKVKSNTVWRNFKLEIEDLIRINNLNVIDATEGGALIQGTKIMSLEEVLSDMPEISISYAFKSFKVDNLSILNKIESFKNFFIENIDENIEILKKQKKINVNKWQEFLLNYSKAEKYFYFPHFHSANSSLLVFYYNNKQFEKIYSLLDDMIYSSEVLREYIVNGFKVGKDFLSLLSELSTISCHTDFENESRTIEFMIKNRFPFEAINLLTNMETKYKNEAEKMIEIYKFFILIHSGFFVEKASDAHKVIYYFLKLIKLDNSCLKNKNLIFTIRKIIEIILEEYKLMRYFGKFESSTLNRYLNSILEILLIINDVEKQCEALEFISPDFETLETLTIQYNCLIHRGKIKTAKRLLQYMARKFPENGKIILELQKHNERDTTNDSTK